MAQRGFIPVRMGSGFNKASRGVLPTHGEGGIVAPMATGVGMQVEITLKSGHRVQVHGLQDQQITTFMQQLLA